ncbi:MAG TPA: NAD-dependent epimerase/dehydratase family protein [Candidatus Limiplasma sp.]|nr:NAD-dependent epimerase/dehydratase family protein [Candidatus Limiplasma sp.]
MKRILIAGAGSYLGERIAAWLNATPERFQTVTLDMRDPAWSASDFSGFDAVVMVAGIAHRKETPENAALYTAVNCRLAVETAAKAKAAGVLQFVFFSTMSVYGLTVGRIHADTPAAPNTLYGQSKLSAEQALAAMADEHFHLAVLRPPMIYGHGCKGNYPRLSALVQKLPAFPRVPNERSMLYIDCLCQFMARLLESGEGGLYFPQNEAFVSTDSLVRQIALAHGKRLWQPRGLGWLLAGLAKRGGAVGKVFGTLTYDQAMSQALREDAQPAFEATVRAAEGCL